MQVPKLLAGIGDGTPGSARRLLAANALPHPRWLDALPNAVSVLTKGGAIWVIGALVARLFRVRGSGRALGQLLPSVVGTTLVVEYPLKALFRRPRPLSATVRSLVLRKRGRGPTSFPSGQTASSFAAAWALSTVWPRWAPVFFGLASAVGFNRVYLGAHHPSDTLAGAVCGVLLAELVRCGERRLHK